jgi:hypothetical protein
MDKRGFGHSPCTFFSLPLQSQRHAGIMHATMLVCPFPRPKATVTASRVANHGRFWFYDHSNPDWAVARGGGYDRMRRERNGQMAAQVTHVPHLRRPAEPVLERHPPRSPPPPAELVLDRRRVAVRARRQGRAAQRHPASGRRRRRHGEQQEEER